MDLSVRSDTIGQGDQSWLGSRHAVQSAKTVTIARASLTANTHYPTGFLKSGMALAKATSGTYSGLWVPLAAAADEAQTVTLANATGGTFTLTFDGETTAGIAFNAAASAVRTALEALSNLNPGDVTVTGSAGGPYTVTFAGAATRSGRDVPQMTASGGSLTGTSPTVTVATSTGGGAGVTDGSDVLDVLLLTDVSVPATGTGDIVAPGLWHGRIVTSRLPFAISAAQRAGNPQFKFD